MKVAITRLSRARQSAFSAAANLSRLGWPDLAPRLLECLVAVDHRSEAWRKLRVAYQLSPPAPADGLERVVDAVLRGDPLSAVQACDSVLEVDRQNDRAIVWRCEQCIALGGASDVVLTAISLAIRERPELARLGVLRASVLWDRGDPAGCKEDLERAIELDGFDPEAWLLRAQYHGALGAYQEAESDCDHAIGLGERWPRAYRTRSFVRFQLGKLEGSIEDATQALDLDPLDAVTWMYRGVSHARLHQRAAALDDLTRAIEIDPSLDPPYNTRGMVLWELGDLRGALADLDRYIELDPTDEIVFASRAGVRLALGDATGAVDDCEASKQLAEGHGKAVPPEVWRYTGAAHAILGHKTEAIEAYEQALKWTPHDRLAIERELSRLRR